MTLAAAILVVVQTGSGMVANLYVTVPSHHHGAKPANYFTGSLHSVAWAIASGKRQARWRSPSTPRSAWRWC